MGAASMIGASVTALSCGAVSPVGAAGVSVLGTAVMGAVVIPPVSVVPGAPGMVASAGGSVEAAEESVPAAGAPCGLPRSSSVPKPPSSSRTSSPISRSGQRRGVVGARLI